MPETRDQAVAQGAARAHTGQLSQGPELCVERLRQRDLEVAGAKGGARHVLAFGTEVAAGVEQVQASGQRLGPDHLARLEVKPIRQPSRVGLAAARELDLTQSALDQDDLDHPRLQVLWRHHRHRRLHALRQVQRLDVAQQSVQVVAAHIAPQVGLDHIAQLRRRQQLAGREQHLLQKNRALEHRPCGQWQGLRQLCLGCRRHGRHGALGAAQVILQARGRIDRQIGRPHLQAPQAKKANAVRQPVWSAPAH